MMGGALDALDAAMRAFLTRGDAIAVESPGYPALLQLARLHGLKAVALPLDAEGITATGLARALALDVRAVFITSRAQNPTGVSISRERGEELGQALRRHRGPWPLVVDDDHFSLLASSPYVPWFTGIKGLRWMTVRSVSKFLGPDMRLAAAAGDEATLAALGTLNVVTRRWQSQHMQRLAHGLLCDPAVRRRIGRAKAAYARRREALLGGLPAGRAFSAANIDGLNVWIAGESAGQLDAWLLGRGWASKTGEHFAPAGPPAGLRLTCATLGEAQCRRVARDVDTFFRTFHHSVSGAYK
jgi:DNA-binding transcriptional MocR family regulator